MSHGLTAEQKAAIIDGVVRPVVMVRFDFSTGVVAVHSAVGTIIYDGDTYTGVGNYGSIGGITEGLSSRPYDITLSLSGIPLEHLAVVMDEHYQGRSVIIYLCLYDEDHQPIGPPVLIWSGTMDYADVELGETASVVVHARRRLSDWQRPRISRYSHEDQVARYPGDLGLEFVATMVEKQLMLAAS